MILRFVVVSFWKMCGQGLVVDFVVGLVVHCRSLMFQTVGAQTESMADDGYVEGGLKDGYEGFIGLKDGSERFYRGGCYA